MTDRIVSVGDDLTIPSGVVVPAARVTDLLDVAASASQGAKADAALPAASLDTSVDALVSDPGSATSAALSSTYETQAHAAATYVQAGIESTQRLMAKMEAELEDAAILVVSDSTGAGATGWVYQLAQRIAADWPAWTVAQRMWNDTGTAYDAATTIQTGTGARTLTVYNASVPGFSTTSWQGPRAATAIYTLTPDLVILSLGHNEQALSAAPWFGRYAALSETITARITEADVLVIAQNPETANSYQQLRREVYRELATRRGYGFVDVCQAFIDTGDVASYTADGVHPNSAGYTLWASTVAAAFKRDQRIMPNTLTPSSLLVPGINFLLNGDFRDGETRWTLRNCTSAVDTTNYETSRNTDGSAAFTSTARKFTTTAAAQATLSQYFPHTRARGRWVTAAARVYVPSGQAYTVGVLALADSTGSTLSNAENGAQGAFRWIVVTRFIPATATFARVLFYVDAGTAGGSNCTIDRIVVVSGKLPQDMALA